MISKDYSLYISSILLLTKSLILKSDLIANQINNYLSKAGHIISDDRTTWKYYLNLAGEPFALNSSLPFSDKEIFIKTIETNETIVFNKANLDNFTLTKNEYKLKSSLYNELLTSHPESELYINGVLFPIDVNVSTTANEWEILHYDTQYVEVNEIRLIEKLQSRIYLFAERWLVPAYCFFEELYLPSFIASLVTSIPATIVNLRLEACRTDEVHSFHIYNYLNDYFGLGSYITNLHHGQVMWLYRNIDYIVKHSGSIDTLNFINENFIKPYAMTLNEFSIHQTKVNTLPLLELNSENVTTDAFVIRKEYNSKLSTDDKISTAVLTHLLQNNGILNPINFLKDVEKLDTSLRKTPQTSLNTNVIECAVATNVRDSLVNTLFEKVNTWIYLTLTDRIKYRIQINVNERVSGNFSITAQQGLAILIYGLNKLYGVANQVSDVLPTIHLNEILIHPIASKSDILSMVEEKYFPEIYFDALINTLPDMTRDVSNLNDFTTLMNDVIDTKAFHKLLLSNEPSRTGRTELNNLFSMFYRCDDYTLYNGITTFSDVFYSANLHVDTFTDATVLDIVNQIAKQFLNIPFEFKTLNEPYNSMYQVLKTICSYNLQFVTGYNLDDANPSTIVNAQVDGFDVNELYNPLHIHQLLSCDVNCSEIYSFSTYMMLKSSISIEEDITLSIYNAKVELEESLNSQTSQLHVLHQTVTE